MMPTEAEVCDALRDVNKELHEIVERMAGQLFRQGRVINMLVKELVRVKEDEEPHK